MLVKEFGQGCRIRGEPIRPMSSVKGVGQGCRLRSSAKGRANLPKQLGQGCRSRGSVVKDVDQGEGQSCTETRGSPLQGALGLPRLQISRI